MRRKIVTWLCAGLFIIAFLAIDAIMLNMMNPHGSYKDWSFILSAGLFVVLVKEKYNPARVAYFIEEIRTLPSSVIYNVKFWLAIFGLMISAMIFFFVPLIYLGYHFAPESNHEQVSKLLFDERTIFCVITVCVIAVFVCIWSVPIIRKAASQMWEFEASLRQNLHDHDE